MRFSVFMRILAAVILPLIVVYAVCAVIVSNSVQEAQEAHAFQTIRLHAESELALYRTEFPERKSDVFFLILSEDGVVVYTEWGDYTGKSLASVLIDRISIQSAEKFSDFIRNPGAFYSYNSSNSYMGILPFTEDGVRFFIFVDVRADKLPTPYGTMSVLPVIIAGVVLIIILLFFAVGKSFTDEKKLITASVEEETSEPEHEPEPSAQPAFYPLSDYSLSEEALKIFFGMVSHEIRTPMNSILGLTQILLKENRLSESQKKHVSDIKTSADSLLRVMSDILDLSKLSSGKMALYMTDYNFIQLTDTVNTYGKFIAERKGLKYEFSINGKLPQCLYGDNARLRQLLMNIINNAVKFTDNGSVSLKITVNENELLFEIRDTGKGMKPEHIAGLFNPLRKMTSPGEYKQDDLGVGMGLPIAKKLIDLMDGEINVTSEYGTGSTFMITMPKIEGDKSKLQTKTIKNDLYFSKDTRILIVDDNEINLSVAEGIVSSLYGIECDMALSGSEALALVSERKYDLVLMDHMMPEMDGVETTKRIREMGGARASVPIIALTANAVVGTKDMLIKAGMNDFLTKPVMIDEMNTTLQKWLPKEKRVYKAESEPQEDNLLNFMEKGGKIITSAMSIHELDVNAGLSCVAFKEDIYENSLKLLLGKIPSILEITEKCLTENNLPDYTTHIHGMKGSLAAIGAISLSKLAGSLEDAGKAGIIEICQRSHPEFAERLEKLREQLAVIFADESTSEKKAGTREELNECLDNLTEAVENYNYELITSIVTRLTELDFGMEINSDTNLLKSYAESFDYESILKVVSGLKDEIV